MSFKERLRGMLQGDPARVGEQVKDREGNILETRLGEIQLYEMQRKRYEDHLAHAEQDFQFAHLNQLELPGYGNLQAQRANLTGPVKALERALVENAYKRLTPEQLAKGPVKMSSGNIDQIDSLTMWSLTIIGACLIAGLFSRLSALGGAALLTLFYLNWPPWPGIPHPPGMEHSFIVNKNLIEAIALLVIAVAPTGRWFGVDATIRRLISSKKDD